MKREKRREGMSFDNEIYGKPTAKEVIQKTRKIVRAINIVILVCTLLLMSLTNGYRLQLLSKLESRTIPEIEQYIGYVKYIPSPLLGTVGMVTLGNDLINSAEDIAKLLTIVGNEGEESSLTEEEVAELRKELQIANEIRLKSIPTGDTLVNKIGEFDNHTYKLIDTILNREGTEIDEVQLEEMTAEAMLIVENTINLLYKLGISEFIIVGISINTLFSLIFKCIGYIRKVRKENRDGEWT